MELVEKLEYLRMKPGDVLVLKLTQHLPPGEMVHLVEAVKSYGDRVGIKVMIVGYELEVEAVQRPSLNEVEVQTSDSPLKNWWNGR